MFSCLALLFTLGACAGDEPSETDTQSSDSGTPITTPPTTTTTTTPAPTTPPVCGIEQILPASSTLDVGDVIQMVLTQPLADDETYQLSITQDGVMVPGVDEWSTNGKVVTFLPERSLLHNTTYQISASACGTSLVEDKTTAPLPLAPVGGENIKIPLRFADVDRTEPPLAAVLLGLTQISGLYSTLSFDDTTGSFTQEVDLIRASWDRGCRPSISEEVALCHANRHLSRSWAPLQGSYDNPVMTSELDGLTSLTTQYGDIDVEDLTYSAIRGEDGTSIHTVVLEAKVDTSLVLDGPCASSYLVTAMAGSCVPCTSADSGECLLLRAEFDDPVQAEALQCTNPDYSCRP